MTALSESQTFASWEVLMQGPNSKSGAHRYYCLCRGCARPFLVRKDNLLRGHTSRCSYCNRTRISLDVKVIREMYRTMTQKAIAKRFGCNRMTINRLLAEEES